MIDAIMIIEVMAGDAITIYIQVFLSDYKREYKWVFSSNSLMIFYHNWMAILCQK